MIGPRASPLAMMRMEGRDKPIMRYVLASSALIVSSLPAIWSQTPITKALPHVLTCGRSAVVESEIDTAAGVATLVPVWTWTPAHSKGMPEKLVKNFSTIDECKPASGGDEILVTSSHDAVAIVSRKNGATLFSANVKNAHTAVLLPDNLLAVASSDAADGTGDRIVFFDRRVSNTRLGEQPIHAAHGLVWDEQRKVLWALGMEQLLKLRVRRNAGGDVNITLLKEYSLPETTGHDFHLSLDCSTLYLSTTHHVFEFLIAEEAFKSFPGLGDTVDVKSFSIDPNSARVAYTVADPGGYWTWTLRFAHPVGTTRLPSPIYKTRWVTDLTPSCER